MRSVLKCGQYLIRPVFKIEQYKNEEGEEGFLRLLIVERSKDEIWYIVDEFSNKNNKGCFVECFCLEEALALFKLVLGFSFMGEWHVLIQKENKSKKPIIYNLPCVPWFYSANKKIIEDTFIFSE